VAAQTAKQVIIQRIREAEREAVYEEYKEKEGEIISGIVQRVEGEMVFVDIGRTVGILPPSEQVRGERYRVNQRIRVYVVKVDVSSRDPEILLSRSHPGMLRRLFELEVPEIFAGSVEIKGIAREASERSKVAVWAKEEVSIPWGRVLDSAGHVFRLLLLNCRVKRLTLFNGMKIRPATLPTRCRRLGLWR
jgi:N utilization substance protein A